MGVYNVHERLLPAGEGEVGGLIDTLAGGDADRLWPGRAWPRLTLDRPLTVGAVGGHGPVRYTVAAYVPGKWVRFRFDAPRGFHGFHEFAVLPVDAELTALRHTLAMTARGPARIGWPLLWRPLHDALIEDSLDRAETACAGRATRPARWSPYVRLLHGLIGRAGRRRDTA
ncbi:SRPBCC family protein [Streptomyces sp. NPDC059875]|uniref:SRPBCC family protein n=1 Tax=unclassified Streptomyces TaxID=2593676 RepID=UPI00365344B5